MIRIEGAGDGRPVTRAAFSRIAGRAPRAQIGFRSRATPDRSEETQRKTRQAVARAKEGDREAFQFLYVTYSGNVYGYVRSIIRDDHEAEDVTQQVFAKLMTSIIKYDERGAPFFAWLVRFARNVAIDQLRVNRATPCENVVDPELPGGADFEHTLTVREALAGLPEDQRDVVVLRHLVGLSPGEIADRMGRTESSINGLHHRGRRALQQELVRQCSQPATAARKRLAAA